MVTIMMMVKTVIAMMVAIMMMLKRVIAYNVVPR